MTNEEFLIELFKNTNKLKKHRIELFVDTPSHRIHGTYENQPFILEIREDVFIAFAMKTEVQDFFKFFVEALSSMFKKNPLCTYLDKNAKLTICEWCYKSEEDRFEHLLNSNHVENLRLYDSSQL